MGAGEWVQTQQVPEHDLGVRVVRGVVSGDRVAHGFDAILGEGFQRILVFLAEVMHAGVLLGPDGS